jgi:hypothetical protein
MPQSNHRAPSADPAPRASSRWSWPLVLGCVIVIVLGVLLPRHRTPCTPATSLNAAAPAPVAAAPHAAPPPRSHLPSGPTVPAEQIVADKVARFTDSRLRILRAMAEHFKVKVAPDVEQYFQAVAAGRWEELNAGFEALKKRRERADAEDLRTLWGPILEAQLIAECAHDWPAQKLLDYGQATLGSLKTGMVYVGGTDPGRGIPTLLNETSDGEQHIVITQNGLADGTYLQYLTYLYGDRMATLTPEDNQRAFQEYMDDARKRLAHDQQFPDEPKQVRPGEDLRMVNDRFQVSGQVAVMAINENLLRILIAKNPNLSFALEESYPLKSTYPNAAPLGPLMELDLQDVQAAFTRQTATQTVNYWRDSLPQLLSDPAAAADSPDRLTYAKMAAAQAALLTEHQFPAEAEQTYREALQISPASPQAAYGLAQLLTTTGRPDEARQLVADFERAYPSKGEAAVWKFLYSSAAAGIAAPQ